MLRKCIDIFRAKKLNEGVYEKSKMLKVYTEEFLEFYEFVCCISVPLLPKILSFDVVEKKRRFFVIKWSRKLYIRSVYVLQHNTLDNPFPNFWLKTFVHNRNRTKISLVMSVKIVLQCNKNRFKDQTTNFNNIKIKRRKNPSNRPIKQKYIHPIQHITTT